MGPATSDVNGSTEEGIRPRTTDNEAGIEHEGQRAAGRAQHDSRASKDWIFRASSIIGKVSLEQVIFIFWVIDLAGTMGNNVPFKLKRPLF